MKFLLKLFRAEYARVLSAVCISLFIFSYSSIASPHSDLELKVRGLVGGQFLSSEGRYLLYTTKSQFELSSSRIKIFQRDLSIGRSTLIASGVFGPASMSGDGNWIVFRGGNETSVVLFSSEEKKGRVLEGKLKPISQNGHFIGPIISEDGNVISYLAEPRDSHRADIQGDLVFYFQDSNYYVRYPVTGDDVVDINFSRSGLSVIIDRETLGGELSLITKECFQLTSFGDFEADTGLFCERQSSKIVGKNSLSEEAFFAMMSEPARSNSEKKSSTVTSTRLVDNVGVSEGVYIPKEGQVITSPYGKGVAGPSYSELGDIVVFLTDSEPTVYGEESKVNKSHRLVMRYDLAMGELVILDKVKRSKGERLAVKNSSFLDFTQSNLFSPSPVVSGDGKTVVYASKRGVFEVISVLRNL